MINLIKIILAMVIYPICALGEGFRIFEFFVISNHWLISSLISVVAVLGITFFVFMDNKIGRIYTISTIILALYISIKPVHQFWLDNSGIVEIQKPVEPTKPVLQTSIFWDTQKKLEKEFDLAKAQYSEDLKVYNENLKLYTQYMSNPQLKHPDWFQLIHKILAAIFLSLFFPAGLYFSSELIIAELKSRPEELSERDKVLLELQKNTPVTKIASSLNISRQKVYMYMKEAGLETKPRTAKKQTKTEPDKQRMLFKVINGGIDSDRHL